MSDRSDPEVGGRQADDGEILRFPLERLGQLDHLVTKRELAERWGVSPRWIELRMRDAGLPFEKDQHSRFVRFLLVDCEHWRARRGARRADG
jgi:hypothetical protein